MEKLKIYLAGSIPKGDAERDQFENWREVYAAKILEVIPNAAFLDPDLIRDTVGPELVVGHDLWQISRSDIILVSIPEKVGAGTSQEMVIAKHLKKPVVTILPKDTHHRRSNIEFDGEMIEDWIHPFIFVSSDHIVESIDEAVVWIKNFQANPTAFPAKDMSAYDKTINRFEIDLADIAKVYEERGW